MTMVTECIQSLLSVLDLYIGLANNVVAITVLFIAQLFFSASFDVLSVHGDNVDKRFI